MSPDSFNTTRSIPDPPTGVNAAGFEDLQLRVIRITGGSGS
jgi:hypothetical protein